MCEKTKYGNFHIDPCMVQEVQSFNEQYKACRTILCCCGHGKYHKTLVFKDLMEQRIYEYYSGVSLKPFCKNGKWNKRHYVKDSEGYYYIPEVEAYYQQKGELK